MGEAFITRRGGTPDLIDPDAFWDEDELSVFYDEEEDAYFIDEDE